MRKIICCSKINNKMTATATNRLTGSYPQMQTVSPTNLQKYSAHCLISKWKNTSFLITYGKRLCSYLPSRITIIQPWITGQNYLSVHSLLEQHNLSFTSSLLYYVLTSMFQSNKETHFYVQTPSYSKHCHSNPCSLFNLPVTHSPPSPWIC